MTARQCGTMVVLGLAAAGLLAGLGGCSKSWYKEDADRGVYQIIDEKWQEDFPSKANYRISDVAPSEQDVVAPAAAEVRGRLSLAEAVALATAHNRDYQTQKEGLYLAALSLTQARHEFAPQLAGALNGGYAKSPGGETVSGGANLGLGQSLAEGMDISLRVATDWLRYLTGDPRTSLGSVLSATVSQPLLRGAGRAIVQENLTQAERSMLYQLRDFNRYRQQFVVSRVSEYYNVLRNQDQVENERKNYESLSYIHQRYQALADAGRVERLRAADAMQNMLQARDNYVRAQETYREQLDRYKITLGLPTEAAVVLDPNELKALERLGVSDPNYDEGALIATALRYRLDLANTMDEVADVERQLKVAENGLLPLLRLTGGLSASTPGDTQQLARFQFQQGTYRLGFEFDPDLDRLPERNAYRRALISMTRQRRAYEQAVDQVTFDARQALRNLREAASVYTIRQMSLKLAQKRVDGEQLKLQAGTSVIRDLLDAQQSLVNAQNALTNALVGYTVAQLEFARDLGILAVQPDGLWEVRTP